MFISWFSTQTGRFEFSVQFYYISWSTWSCSLLLFHMIWSNYPRVSSLSPCIFGLKNKSSFSSAWSYQMTINWKCFQLLNSKVVYNHGHLERNHSRPRNVFCRGNPISLVGLGRELKLKSVKKMVRIYLECLCCII